MTRYSNTYEWTPEGVCVAEFDVEVEFDYSPATPNYFDRSFGNWLPGDPANLEITDVWLLELAAKKPRKVPCPDWLADLVIQHAYAKWADAMVDNANEDAWVRQQEAADARRDWNRENREEY